MEQEQNIFEEELTAPQQPLPTQEPTWGESLAQNTPKSEPYRMTFADPIYEAPYAQAYQKPKKVKKKKNRKGGKVVLCILLALLIALGSGVGTALVMNGIWQTRFDNLELAMKNKADALQQQINELPRGGASAGGQTATPGELLTPGQVYQQNAAAVVAITSYVQEFNYFGPSGTYQSFGSGFIISADGYVVSNYHVVENATEIEVVTTENQTMQAELVGYDQTNDIVLLKVEAEDLPHVILGSSSVLDVGDQVAAIGNPLGELTSTMTIGYVSAKDRVVTTDGSTINMIQTDAAINSGNSGGPLFNMKGEVVGIITAKYSGTSSGGTAIEGIGFAIPMDDVIGMIEDLRDLGYIAGAYLGVMVRDVDTAAQAYGVPAGAYVDEVTPGYAAEAAGMLDGDIITDLGGYTITSVSELTRMLRRFEPGETVSVTVYRGGRDVQLRVTLDEKPREESAAKGDYLMPGDEGFEQWYEEFIRENWG